MPYDVICREMLFSGFYERELLMGMCQLVGDRAGTVLDVGANMGNHTVFFSRMFERVISFEPVQRNCWILKANLDLNSIGNVQLVEKALGDTAEQLYIAHNDPRETNNSLSRSNVGGANIVDVVRGDDELGRLSYPSPVLMIKIDVEGFEPQVISGLEQTISSHKPIIYWEAFSKDKVNESRVLLQKLGYENFYHLTTNRFQNKLMNKLANSLGRSVYLKPLDECVTYEGMNVASPKKLL